MPEPPSRNSNPFATCWTGTATLPYQPVAACEPESVVCRLDAGGWRGQVVGPHGAGKSALLAALAEPIVASGRRPVSLDEASGDPGEVVLAEGFERMGRAARKRVLAMTAVVVTTHRPIRDGWRRLPVVARLAPDNRLLTTLYLRVADRVATPVTHEDAKRSFARRNGNLREVWFDLYNLHERRTRPSRTSRVTLSYQEC